MCDHWILDGQMHVSCGSQGSLANLKYWDEPGEEKIGKDRQLLNVTFVLFY